MTNKELWEDAEYRAAHTDGYNRVNPPKMNWTFKRVMGWLDGRKLREDVEFFDNLPEGERAHDERETARTA